MKAKSKLVSLFEWADILSQGPSLFIDGKSSFRNMTGAVLSSILVVLSIVGFFYFADQVFAKTNPTVAFNQIYQTQGTSLKINTSLQNNFEFYIVNGTDSQTYEDQEDLWSFNAWMSTWDFVNNTEVILGGSQIHFTRCVNSKIQNSFCFAPGQNLELSNAFIQFPYTLFYISIRQCIDRPTCKSPEEIREKLKYSFLKVRVPTYYINSDNYENPLVQYVQATESMLTSDFTRRAYYFFSEIQYHSDSGFILQDTTYTSQVELSNFYDQTGIMRRLNGKKGEDIYFESFWAFESSAIQKVYKRRYTKIQDILAQVGGFINFLRIVAFLMMMVYFEFGYYSDILSKFNLFERGKDESGVNPNYNKSTLAAINHNQNKFGFKLEDKHPVKTINIVNVSNILPRVKDDNNPEMNVPVHNTNTNNVNAISKYVNTEKAMVNTKRKFLKLPNLWSYFKAVTCCKKNTLQTFKDRLLLNYLDVKSLIYLRNEMETMKYYVLDRPESLAIHDYLKNQINQECNDFDIFKNEKEFLDCLNFNDSPYKAKMLEFYENY